MLNRLLIFICLNWMQCAAYAEDNPFAERSLRIGFFLESFPYISPTEADIGLRYWTDKIGQDQNVLVTLDFYANSQLLREDFSAGKVNLVVASPLVILKDFDPSMLAEGFGVSHGGNFGDNVIVVTRNNDGIKGFKDLKGKKIGMMTNDAIGEMILDILTLTHFGKPYSNVFPKLSNEDKRSQLILNLFFKKVDAVIIYERSYQVAVELNPQIKERTQIISKFDGLNWGLGLFHRDVPKDFREYVLSVITKLGSSPDDQQILRIFEADKFERADIKDLHSIAELRKLRQKLLSQSKKKL